jgi:hypothetical protein
MGEWMQKKRTFLEVLPDDRKDNKDVKELQILLEKLNVLNLMKMNHHNEWANIQLWNATMIPSGNESTALNQRVMSITHESLLYVPPNKDPLAPMHSLHGIMESCGSNVCDEVKGANIKPCGLLK